MEQSFETKIAIHNNKAIFLQMDITIGRYRAIVITPTIIQMVKRTPKAIPIQICFARPERKIQITHEKLTMQAV